MPIKIHETQFHFNASNGIYRGLCTCGWVKFGTLVECQSAAATHDMEWEAVDVTAPASVDSHA